MELTGKKLGDYKLLRRLGKGGMGEVYLAEQISLKRKVALKLLRPDLAANVNALKRFKAEAEAVAKATHANIVQVYAIHEIAGIHLIALEFVEGRNLREFLEKKGPPETLLGLSIMRQVAAALQRASELGIIHRDIKPENILLTRKGEVKVADFGLSRIFADDDTGQPNLTQTGVTMGTPLYMSPEQVEGKKNIDHRTDIYSFGVTCYHMFAGHPPFKGTGPFEVAVQHVQKEPAPLATIRPDLPPELCVIIHKMMAKAPDDRYQLSREIARDVARLRDGIVGSSQTLSPSGAVLPLQKSADAMTTLVMRRPQSSPWPRRLLFASLPLALAAGFMVAWVTQSNPPAPAMPAVQPEETKASLSQKEKEKALLALFQDLNAKPTDARELIAGLKYSIDLGLLYLNERERLNDAEKLFNDLIGKQHIQYKTFGKLGKAMVLAFKDQPEESNKLFLAILDKEKTDKELRNSWMNNRQLREMLAKALNFNMQNNPAAFPEKLRPYLHPPAATLKTP